MTLPLLTSAPLWLLLKGAAYRSLSALLLFTLHLQMAEGSLSGVHSLCISLWGIISAGKAVSKKRPWLLVPKISIYHLKCSKRSQSLAIRLRAHTSDGWAECAASSCAVPPGEASDLDALLLTRKRFWLCSCRWKDPCRPASISPPIITLNRGLIRAAASFLWPPRPSFLKEASLGHWSFVLCFFWAVCGRRKQEASVTKGGWNYSKLCPFLETRKSCSGLRKWRMEARLTQSFTNVFVLRTLSKNGY